MYETVSLRRKNIKESLLNMFYAFLMAHYALLDFYLEDTVVKYTAYTFKNLKTTFYSWEKITRNTSFQSIAGLEQKNKKGWIFVSGLNIQCTCQRLLQSLKASPGKSDYDVGKQQYFRAGIPDNSITSEATKPYFHCCCLCCRSCAVCVADSFI